VSGQFRAGLSRRVEPVSRGLLVSDADVADELDAALARELAARDRDRNVAWTPADAGGA
jgi:hypothetical protein